MAESVDAEKKKRTIHVFCCNECAEPLELNGKKRVCPSCGIAPAVNDIFIKRVCPECNVQTKESASCDEYVCPSCNQVYAV